MIKGLSLLLLGFGVFVLMQVVMPYLSFTAWELFAFNSQQGLIDPAPVSANGDLPDFSIENVGNFPAFTGKGRTTPAPYHEFKITVPKLKLDATPVFVESLDFDKTLAHLPGTALPGEKGNVFISGHSMLPALASKDTKAFFAKLPDMQRGDEIVVDAVGQRYTYTVTEMKIVDPKDMNVILPPDSNGRFLSLMTCVPPGFNTKRLVVIAKLDI